MFSLQIHSVDTNHPLTEFAGEQSGAPIDSASANPNPNIQERRGIIHLFRSVSRHSTSVPPNLDIQSTTELFVVAVPNHLSSDDFIRFCGSYIDSVVEMLLIRNDGIEDRYSVLIKLVDQKSADNFYSNLNGRRFSSMEAEIFDEYNRLLATQLENQRQYYETLLVEAKGKKEKAISEAVEKAITLNLQDIQFKLDKCVEEKKAVSEMHENLLKNQELLRQQVEETEDRERSTMLSMAVKMKDLEEQIRDLSVYIEAQKTVANLPDSDDIKGGTLLPVRQQSSPSPSTSSTSNTKKNKNSRTNRRRK